MDSATVTPTPNMHRIPSRVHALELEGEQSAHGEDSVQAWELGAATTCGTQRTQTRKIKKTEIPRNPKKY
jgi:hypothetical protein